MRTRVFIAGALGAALTLAGSVTALEVALGHWDPVAGIGRRTPIQDIEDLPPGLEPGTGAEMPAEPPGDPALPEEGEEAEEPTPPAEEAPEEPDPPHPSGDTQEPVEQARPVDEELRGIPVHSVAAGGREIVITFDDGPSIYTEEILAILSEKQVPAAFFWLAGSSRIHLAQQVVAQGHQLGSHTIEHVRLTELTIHEQIAEVAGSIEILEAAGGVPVQYFRPPYGSYNVDTLEMAKQLNLGMIMWNVDSRDWALEDNPRQIILNVLSQVKPGSIILLHERKQTVEILPELLDALRAEGYTFRLLPSIRAEVGPTMQAEAETGQPLDLNEDAVPAVRMMTGAAHAADNGTAQLSEKGAAQAANKGAAQAGKSGAALTVPGAAQTLEPGAAPTGKGAGQALKSGVAPTVPGAAQALEPGAVPTVPGAAQAVEPGGSPAGEGAPPTQGAGEGASSAQAAE